MVVVAEVFVAVVLSFVVLELGRASRGHERYGAGVMLVDLCLGLAAVAALVLWAGVDMRVFWGAGG